MQSRIRNSNATTTDPNESHRTFQLFVACVNISYKSLIVDTIYQVELQTWLLQGSWKHINVCVMCS